MATVNKRLRDKLVSQAIKEISFARMYKQARIKQWKKNEDMYYGRKRATDDSRANVDLGKMQGFVHTILSKIDNPLVFKYIKRKEADYRKANLLNSLREKDASSDDWDYKDLLGKKQGLIYGRAIYCYYAESSNGYKSNLEPVDVYDFLIDPAGGGYDMELAFYMGRYGIIKTKQQLKDGVKSGIYINSEVQNLTSGGGNATEMSEEEVNASNRYMQLARTQLRQIQDSDKFKFWEWYTTYDSVRYYLLMTNDGACVKCCELKDLFKSDLWPFWSWAAFPDLTEFWTPSYCDYSREIFMAQSISINQMIDNAEAINKPMKAVQFKLIENPAELKYRKDGYVRIKETDDIRKAFMSLDVPSIDTPLKLYQALDAIQQLESGVTNDAMGQSSEEKVGIYDGNVQAAADRFGLLNKSYAFGYKRFALLYENGAYEHLSKKTAVEITGIDGIDVVEIKKSDIKPRGGYTYLIQASDAETQADTIDKKNKLTFLSNAGANPAFAKIVNWQKAFEMQASIAGFTLDEVKELLDIDSWGNADLMSQAAEDIEKMLDGEMPKPNIAANIAYKQRILDYMKAKHGEMNMREFLMFTNYLQSIEVYVVRNTVSAMTNQMAKMGMAQLGSTDDGTQDGQNNNQAAGIETQQPLPTPNAVDGSEGQQPFTS